MTLDPEALNQLFAFLTGYLVVFLVLLWLALIAWTNRDIKTRTNDRRLQITGVLVSVFLFLPGIFIYLLIRPHKTLDDAFQYSLEEESMLQTLDEYATCPTCQRHIHENWTYCPDCRARLRVECKKCSQPLNPAWNICPFCAAEQSEIPDKPVLPADDEPPSTANGLN